MTIIIYPTKYKAQQQIIKQNYNNFIVFYNGKDNDDYKNNDNFCCGNASKGNSKSGGVINNENAELFQYYYHSDHLGSSSYITNLSGDIVQHIEYVPFGEVFIEEKNNKWNTPYLFNGKELDEETGLYYYGARYYEPLSSLFINVDPLVEKTMQSYAYCSNNPIMKIDPTGMLEEDPPLQKQGTAQQQSVPIAGENYLPSNDKPSNDNKIEPIKLNDKKQMPNKIDLEGDNVVNEILDWANYINNNKDADVNVEKMLKNWPGTKHRDNLRNPAQSYGNGIRIGQSKYGKDIVSWTIIKRYPFNGYNNNINNVWSMGTIYNGTKAINMGQDKPKVFTIQISTNSNKLYKHFLNKAGF